MARTALIDIPVAPEDDGIRLDRWFRRHLPGLAQAHLQKLLRKGDIRLDKAKCEASTRLATGQRLTYPEALAAIAGERSAVKPKSQPASGAPEPAVMQAMVLYKDDRVIALNKPAGLAVQGGSGVKVSIDAGLDGLRFGAPKRPKLVHRLDRDTSGILLLGRDAASAALLAEAFRKREAHKRYWALVVGNPLRNEGLIDLPIGKNEAAVEKMEVDEEGKRAVTEFRVIERLGKQLAWLELEPLTGRTHQLRVHCAEMGCPIYGDGKYGGREAFLPNNPISGKLHLHARSIAIPSLGLEVTAPLPPHMQRTWRELGLEEGSGV